MEFCNLGSGSSGNCTLLRGAGGGVMVDAGLGPRDTSRRMTGTGVLMTDVRAIVLTHLDADHFRRDWVGEAIRRGIKIFCHARLRDTVAGGSERALSITRTFYDGRAFEVVPGLSFEAIPLAHDETGSHGFVIEGFGSRIGFATDLGHVPDVLIERFERLDILAIECNYDPVMQAVSARPTYLKNRIMGGRGHLSNEQAYAAVRKIFDRSQATGHAPPGHVVLLHRSRQCNCPKLVRELFSRDPRLGPRLVLTDALTRTEWLRPREVAPAVGEQLVLGFGK